MFFRPAYYRSMAIRLFVFGGQAVDGRDGAMILYLRRRKFPQGGTYQEIVAPSDLKSARRRLRRGSRAAAIRAACWWEMIRW